MSENAQLQREFLESLNFLVSLGNASKKEHLNSLTEREIIDNESFEQMCHIISHAKKLKDGFEFILFDNPFQAAQISKCVEAIKILENERYNTARIEVFIERINERISNIQLNDHEGIPGTARENNYSSVILILLVLKKVEVIYGYFQICLNGNDVNVFSFYLGKNQFKLNLYDNLMVSIPRDNPQKYAVKMFGCTVCVEKELSIEASSDLKKFELVYLDNIRIPICVDSEITIDIVPIGKNLK